MTRWLTSREACDRLGVRPQTLYAYASRGLLTPRRDRSRSLYPVEQVEGLAQRTARGRRPGRLEIQIDTEITLIDPAGRLFYRGVDIAEIAGRWSFERTAEWIWSGVDRGETVSWSPEPRRLVACQAAQRVLPADTPLDARVLVSAAIMAAAEATQPTAGREETGPAGRVLIAAIVDSLPALVQPTSPPDDSIAGRLSTKLVTTRPKPSLRAAVDTALVLLADHELATSTLAARIAASTQSGTVHSVLAGLAVLAGPRHGDSDNTVQALYRQAESQGARQTVDELLREKRLIPGTGQRLYRVADPRFQLLLQAVLPAIPPAKRQVVRQVADAVSQRSPRLINADLALGALAYGADMAPGAGSTIFALSRIVGWIAHTTEEAGHTVRFRPRAIYTGLRPTF